MEGMPEQQYEDSAQKADRLWQEYEKIAEEQHELIAVNKKDREVEVGIFNKIEALYEEYLNNLGVLQEETRKAFEDISNRWEEQAQLAQEFVAYVRLVRSGGKDFARDELFADQVDEFTRRLDIIKSEALLVDSNFYQKLSTLTANKDEKLASLRSDRNGIQGDIKGTNSILDSNWEKAATIKTQLKEMGEVS